MTYIGWFAEVSSSEDDTVETIWFGTHKELQAYLRELAHANQSGK